MKRLLMGFFVLSFSTIAAAADFGLELGFRQQSGSVDDMTGASTKSQVGYALGLSAFIPFQGPLGLRTGLMYTQRPLSVEADSPIVGDAKVNLSYFDVPVTLAYKFEDFASVFGGVVLALNLENGVSTSGAFTGGKLADTKSIVTPIVFGASFKFASQLGATVFFETIPGDVTSFNDGVTKHGVNGYRAVGANLVFSYD